MSHTLVMILIRLDSDVWFVMPEISSLLTGIQIYWWCRGWIYCWTSRSKNQV